MTSRLLLVEDDRDVSDAVADVLREEGNTVCAAYDGRQALALLEREPFDVVLLDVEMPVLDGRGFAREVQLRDQGLELIPIVLLSGVPNLAAVAAEVGTPYWLAKPCPLTALLATVDQAAHSSCRPPAAGA